MSGEAYRQMALAELARSDTFFGHPGMEHARRLALLEEDTDEPAAAEAGTHILALTCSVSRTAGRPPTKPASNVSSADCSGGLFDYKVVCLEYRIWGMWT